MIIYSNDVLRSRHKPALNMTVEADSVLVSDNRFNLLRICIPENVSRFAEHLFNVLTPKQGLNWIATSRGLALERGVDNVGAISKHALMGLTKRGVSMALDLRYPLPLTEADLVAASKIIAVDESEHLCLIVERFPNWKDAIEYWLVHDVEYTLPDLALQQFEYNIQQLIEQLPK